MPAVSVIMPVYNSEQYLPQAIESVLNQTFTDFELILIDDGSTDNSGKICRDYAERDRRIIAQHKSNGGICSARNAGLELVGGEYIAFIDNDDTFDPNLIERTYSLAKREDVDCVRFARKQVTTFLNGIEKVDYYGTKGIVHDGEVAIFRDAELKSNYRKIKDSGALYCIWNGLFRREIIERYKIRFDTKIKFGGEDWAFNFEFYEHASSIAFLNQSLYYYNLRQTHSTISKYDYNRVETSIKMSVIEKQLIERMRLEQYDALLGLYIYVLNSIECAKILEKPNCTLSWRNKKHELKRIKENMGQFSSNKLGNILRLCGQTKKKGFLSLLLYFNLYGAVLWMCRTKIRLSHTIQ